MNKNTVFRPSKAETKAESTNTFVKAIIEGETATREAKTARLRAARAERDANAKIHEEAQKASTPKKTPRKKASPKPKPTS